MAVYNHTIGAGQSLGVGGGGSASGGVPDSARMLMFDDTGAAVTYVAPAGEEPPLRQILENVVEHADPAYLMTAYNASQGGSLYTALKKGTAPYNNSITRLTLGNSWAGSNGHTVQVRALHIVHGEGDHGTGTSQTQYAANLLEWHNDYNADCRAVTGQARNIRSFICQLGSRVNSPIARAQLDAHRGRYGAYLIGPKYQLPYTDGTHLTPAGYHYLGELHARAHNTVLIDERAWEPVHPRKITVVGSQIVVDFHVPVAPLVFDTTLIPAQPNMGFSVTNTAGPTLSAVALTGPRQVTLTMTGAPGPNTKVNYGATSIQGNLRDSETAASSLDGTPLPNWAVHFSDPIGYDDMTQAPSSIQEWTGSAWSDVSIQEWTGSAWSDVSVEDAV